MTSVHEQKPKSKGEFMKSALICSNALIDKFYSEGLFKLPADIDNVRKLKRSLYDGNILTNKCGYSLFLNFYLQFVLFFSREL